MLFVGSAVAMFAGKGRATQAADVEKSVFVACLKEQSGASCLLIQQYTVLLFWGGKGWEGVGWVVRFW